MSAMFKPAIIRLLTTLLMALVVFSALRAARFGNDYTTGSAEAYGYAKALVIPTYAFVVTGSIVIDSLFMFGRTTTGTGTMDVAVYQMRNGTPASRLLLRTVSLTQSGGGDYWCGIACTLSVTAPDTICLAYGNPVSKSNYERVAKRDTSAGIHGSSGEADSAMTDPWVHNFWSVQMPCMYAVYHTAGSPSVDAGARRRRI